MLIEWRQVAQTIGGEKREKEQMDFRNLKPVVHDICSVYFRCYSIVA